MCGTEVVTKNLNRIMQKNALRNKKIMYPYSLSVTVSNHHVFSFNRGFGHFGYFLER